MNENITTVDIEENRELESVAFDMGGLKLALWGLLFTACNIRIYGFDIVPDAVGYIMVIIGLGRIEKYEKRFSEAIKICYVLIALALITIYQKPVMLNGADAMSEVKKSLSFSAGMFGESIVLSIILLILGLLANIYFVYCMCMGIKSLYNQVGDSAMAKISDERWKLVAATEAGLLISVFMIMLKVQFSKIMIMIFGSLSFIALVMFLLLIYHAYKDINGKVKDINGNTEDINGSAEL